LSLETTQVHETSKSAKLKRLGQTDMHTGIVAERREKPKLLDPDDRDTVEI
jgi:hypothetical protein